MRLILIIVTLLFSACSLVNKPEENNMKDKNLKIGSINRRVKTETEVVLGEAVTEIIDNGENRVSNIMLSISVISGTKLSFGEEFSFNKITGRKSEGRGYKYAPVLIDGEKSYGLGGGVCQVSSTIYIAAKNAGLEITERHNHSESVAYAPKGMDAAVVYGVKDMKFKNNLGDDIYIYVWVENDKCYCKIIKKQLTL